MEEMFRANLLERVPAGIRITTKGKWIAAAADFLDKQK
jgi:hypothetical protein